MKQLRKKICFIIVEEKAGNNTFNNEKLEILNFCIKEMEKLIDNSKKGAQYCCCMFHFYLRKL